AAVDSPCPNKEIGYISLPRLGSLLRALSSTASTLPHGTEGFVHVHASLCRSRGRRLVDGGTLGPGFGPILHFGQKARARSADLLGGRPGHPRPPARERRACQDPRGPPPPDPHQHHRAGILGATWRSGDG